MKKSVRTIVVLAIMLVLVFSLSAGAFAAGSEAEAAESSALGSKAIAAAIAIGLAAAGGAVAMGIAIAKSNEGIARQPEAEGKIRTSMMLGLVFIVARAYNQVRLYILDSLLYFHGI